MNIFELITKDKTEKELIYELIKYTKNELSSFESDEVQNTQTNNVLGSVLSDLLSKKVDFNLAYGLCYIIRKFLDEDQEIQTLKTFYIYLVNKYIEVIRKELIL